MLSIFKRLTAIFKPPQLRGGRPDLRSSFSSPDGSVEEQARRHNEVEIARATYEITRDAFQKNLNIAYGALVVSTLAVIVAIAALITTIKLAH